MRGGYSCGKQREVGGFTQGKYETGKPGVYRRTCVYRRTFFVPLSMPLTKTTGNFPHGLCNDLSGQETNSMVALGAGKAGLPACTFLAGVMASAALFLLLFSPGRGERA